MANRHTKTCSMSLMIERCKLKPQWDIASHLPEWLPSINQQTSAGEDVKEREPWCTIGGNEDWYSHCGNSMGIPQKIKNGTAFWYSDPTLGIYPKKPETLIWKNTRGNTPPKKAWNLFIKNCVFILTWLNLTHLQRTLQLMQYTYWDVFSAAQKGFWTCRFWWLLVLLPCFVSSFPHWQNISL